MIGDDELGWGENGVFNIEDGSYAKTIRLSLEDEPLIFFKAAGQFGSILENVVVDPETGVPDYNDGSKTENTRTAYPLSHLPNVELTLSGPHAANIVYLSADAFGVLPPISRLTREQAMYHLIVTPRNTWVDPAEFDVQAGKLAAMFRENFEKYASTVDEAVLAAGPPG